MRQRLYGLQSLKYLQSGSSLTKFAKLWCAKVFLKLEDQNHLEGTDGLIPPPKFLNQQLWGRAQAFTFLTSSQMLPLVLVRGLHLRSTGILVGKAGPNDLREWDILGFSNQPPSCLFRSIIAPCCFEPQNADPSCVFPTLSHSFRNSSLIYCLLGSQTLPRSLLMHGALPRTLTLEKIVKKRKKGGKKGRKTGSWKEGRKGGRKKGKKEEVRWQPWLGIHL